MIKKEGQLSTSAGGEEVSSTERWLRLHRRLLLEIAWMLYMVLVVLGYPHLGVSVMLPSILLCGLASWLFPFKVALLTAGLTLPYHMMVIMYFSGNPQTWSAALEPGGIAAQVLAAYFITISKNTRYKTLALTAEIKTRIKERNDELQEIADFMENRAEADYARMSEQLGNVVNYQLTALLHHSEALKNFLAYTQAPHVAEADKLVAIAKQNIEQVKDLHRRLSAKAIMESGIEQAICDMCTYMENSTGTTFSIIIHDKNRKAPEKTVISLYRITHEAITNALRHGKASHIDIELAVEEKHFNLTIRNNGIPLQNLQSDGVGLQLMLQRAEQVGATVNYTTDSSDRTILTCSTEPENSTGKKLFDHKDSH